jgi:alpha-glucosidase (family GH31 glycosyl hydrolase)
VRRGTFSSSMTALSTHGIEVLQGPDGLEIRRRGRTVVAGLRGWTQAGAARDHFIQLTEGVLAQEVVEPPVEADLDVEIPGPETVRIRVAAGGLRSGMDFAGVPSERFAGLGARHSTTVDHGGRAVWLGADRRYTGPDCPPEMLEVGGIPQGDYAPVPWVLSSRGYALFLRGDGPGIRFDLGPERVGCSARGPLEVDILLDPSPAARLRRYLREVGFPAVLPEWGYGHWKSRDVYAHQADVEDDFEGYVRHNLPLDAIVLDSPWETQYNTWEFNPHQFPDAPELLARMRAAGVRTVVWVTPWVNLDSSVGQSPPDPESQHLHSQPASNYEPGKPHFVKRGGEPFVARWWMGDGSPVDFTSPTAEEWWREQAKRALALGVEGIKADDGEGYYFPPDAQFADGRTGADAAWSYGRLYRESMQRALDEVHPGRGVVFGRSGWHGQQATGILWGGDQASDFWSLRVLVASGLAAAASGFSNWSHDVGGYLGERLLDRCPKELLLRWVQYGCFTPLMHAHGRFPQEAWTYDDETLEVYRRYVVLHERLVPYVRAAAAAAARHGLPIVRPLSLIDPTDGRAWTIADAYGYGPALWVAPVLEAAAAEREVPLPRGRWRDFWTGAAVQGGGTIVADAPLDRIPVWVREGSILVTLPALHVGGGLRDTPEAERPLEATLWGEPPLGHSSVRLADGTRIRWRRGRWSVDGDRRVTFAER